VKSAVREFYVRDLRILRQSTGFIDMIGHHVDGMVCAEWMSCDRDRRIGAGATSQITPGKAVLSIGRINPRNQRHEIPDVRDIRSVIGPELLLERGQLDATCNAVEIFFLQLDLGGFSSRRQIFRALRLWRFDMGAVHLPLV
jgi:hypothetical protein